MSTEVTNATGTELTADAQNLDAWGQGEVSSHDIVIPKIMIMQKMSEAVEREVALEGDFIDSLTEEKLGSIKEPLKFIPFHMNKTWIVQRMQDGDYVFDSIEPVTAANEDRQWEEVVDGIKFKYQKSYNFYVLLESDMSMPYVLSFRSTSAKTGKVLATQMYVKNRQLGKVPPAYVMELGGVKEKNNKGSFIVSKVAVSHEANQEQIGKCLSWYKTVAAGQAKVHEADEAPTHRQGEVKNEDQF